MAKILNITERCGMENKNPYIFLAFTHYPESSPINSFLCISLGIFYCSGNHI